MRISILLFVAGLFTQINTDGQYKYPQHYFRNPLDIPLQLAANFGEVRPNHFHMGLDIRTQGRENLPVFAAADGYVSRIKIEKWGYGKAIYITHPNGYITLYAHLNSFYTALENFVEQQQYEQEKWEQDIDLPAGKFPVTKGQFIALSGNTGGSAGPHLHFEIRDSETGNNLNPLMFDMGIPDQTPPVIRRLFLYDRRYSTYQVAGKEVAIKAGGSNYSTQPGIIRTGTPLLSLGISAEDKTSNSPFLFGIYQAELWMDDSLLNAFQLDNFSYNDTRYVNACIDYTKSFREKVDVQHLSRLPGNKLNIFSEAGGTGIIILNDTLPHKISINVKDVNGNAARLTTMIQYDPSQDVRYPYPTGAQAVLPNHESTVKSANTRLDFSNRAFYDGAPFIIQEQPASNPNAASVKVLLPTYIPVQDSFSMQIKTTLAKNDPQRNKVVMYFINGKSKYALKGTWKGDYMQAKFNKLYTAQLLVDNIPPAITPVGWKNGAKIGGRFLKLRCTDELDEVASFSATLENGQWLLFGKKDDDFTYVFDEHCAPGPHQLTVTVTDKAGNTSTEAYSFTR